MAIRLIAKGIFRAGQRYALRSAYKYGKGLIDSDRMALNYAWKGYKHKSAIVRGLRGSLVTGSVIGNLVQDPDGGTISFKPETYKPYQTRGRYSTGRSNRYKLPKCYSKHRGRSYSSKYYRGRNR